MAFVLFPSEENADRALCVKVLGEFSKLGQADALEAWRRKPGELSVHASAAEASSAAAAAARLGIRCSVFDAAALPVLPSPEPVLKAEVSDEGVRLYRKTVKDFFPYAGLTALGAGVLEEAPPSVNPAAPGRALEEAIRKTLGEPPAAPPGRAARETAFYLDFFTAEGARFRLRWDEADYSWLGRKKEYSSMENFRLTLEELHAFSFGKVPVTAAFTAVRNRAPLAPFRLNGLDAFDFNLRWFLAVTGR